MTLAKLCLGSAGAIGLSSLSFGIWDDQARDLLARCMDRTLNVNVRAIVSQRCVDSNQVLQIKVEQTRSGKSRLTIIAPLQQQGVELVDDGIVMTTYNPDTHRVEVSCSKRGHEIPSSGQVKLAERNYRLSIGDRAKVAGRPAFVVTASPRHKGLALRRYYIDAATAYLLRLEISEPASGTTTYFDTVSVAYPDSIPEPIARAGADEVRRVTAQAKPQQDALDFCGAPPRNLPYGFAIQEIEPLGVSGRSVRISDGLVGGVVYEWKRKQGEEAPGGDNESWGDAGDIRVMVALSVSPDVRKKVLATFLRGLDVGPSTFVLPRSSFSGTPHESRRVQD